jgi:hypothetical protein
MFDENLAACLTRMEVQGGGQDRTDAARMRVKTRVG